jgi:hypothetical protein
MRWANFSILTNRNSRVIRLSACGEVPFVHGVVELPEEIARISPGRQGEKIGSRLYFLTFAAGEGVIVKFDEKQS